MTDAEKATKLWNQYKKTKDESLLEELRELEENMSLEQWTIYWQGRSD